MTDFNAPGGIGPLNPRKPGESSHWDAGEVTPTCSTCRHWDGFAGGERKAPGRAVSVGTCALGGPTPEDGCSDTHASESCPKHEERDK